MKVRMIRISLLVVAALAWPAGLWAQQADAMNSGRRVVTAERLKDD